MGAAAVLGPTFVLLYSCLLALATAVALALRAGLQGPDDASNTPALYPIEIAYLAGGTAWAIAATVASVRFQAAVPEDDRTWQSNALREVLTHDVLPVERVLYTLVARHGGIIDRARREADPLLSAVRSRLTWLKLLAPDPAVQRVRRLQLLLFSAFLALGGVRAMTGEPGEVWEWGSGFLVVGLWIAAAWMLNRVRPAPPYRTRRGERVLEQLRAKHIALLWKLREQPRRLPAKDFALAVALFGESGADGAYDALGSTVTRRPRSSVHDALAPWDFA